MHFKENVSILNLKYELNQIKTYPLDSLKRPPRGPSPSKIWFTPCLPPGPPGLPPWKKNFEILGGLFDPPLKKKLTHLCPLLFQPTLFVSTRILFCPNRQLLWRKNSATTWFKSDSNQLQPNLFYLLLLFSSGRRKKNQFKLQGERKLMKHN